MAAQTVTMTETPKGLLGRMWKTPSKTNNNTLTKSSGPGGDFDGSIGVSQKLPTETDLRNVAELPILNVKNDSVPFKSLYDGEQEGKKVLIIFVRHFFCGVC